MVRVQFAVIGKHSVPLSAKADYWDRPACTSTQIFAVKITNNLVVYEVNFACAFAESTNYYLYFKNASNQEYELYGYCNGEDFHYDHVGKMVDPIREERSVNYKTQSVCCSFTPIEVVPGTIYRPAGAVTVWL